MPNADYAAAANLRASLRQFLRLSEEVSRKHGLTPQQYLLLLMIKASEDTEDRATISQLVERLALTQSTVTELVQRAEDAGLVARRQSPHDGRVVHLSVTPLGGRRLHAAFAELGAERARLLRMIHGS